MSPTFATSVQVTDLVRDGTKIPWTKPLDAERRIT
jgi:hypothetical protein